MAYAAKSPSAINDEDFIEEILFSALQLINPELEQLKASIKNFMTQQQWQYPNILNFYYEKVNHGKVANMQKKIGLMR